MQDHHFDILKAKLNNDFVHLLPPLLANKKPLHLNEIKNLSRALSAWVLVRIADADPFEAAQSVVDDFDDCGIDAVYYNTSTRKLYLVQSKLKNHEDFALGEALKLTSGITDLVNQNYSRFNQHVCSRESELAHALDDCINIVPVVAFTGNALSKHAQEEFHSFLLRLKRDEERLSSSVYVYSPQRIAEDLLRSQAIQKVNTTLTIRGCQKVTQPKVCYYGRIPILDLVEIFNQDQVGNSLFERNIRHFLGFESTVNQAIQQTLKECPEKFFCLNNGVTALAETIEAGSRNDLGQRLRVTGLSVINGAQSIASASAFKSQSPTANFKSAEVLLTLISVSEEERDFSVEVTTARNHQNPIAAGNFSALDPIHERLRRELSLEGVEYYYRPEANSNSVGRSVLRREDAAIALAVAHPDPKFPVLVRSNLGRFNERTSQEYGAIFNERLTGRRVANTTRIFLSAKRIIKNNEDSTSGKMQQFYRYGWAAIIWIIFQKNLKMVPDDRVVTDLESDKIISKPLDDWREKVWLAAEKAMAQASKAPLAFFRTSSCMEPFLKSLKSEPPGE